jgi:hypothetical protein
MNLQDLVGIINGQQQDGNQPPTISDLSSMADMVFPVLPTSLYEQGMDAYMSGDMGSARRFWEQSVSKNQNPDEARRGLERLDQRKATRRPVNPSSLEFYKNGIESYLKNDFHTAAVLFRRAVDADPSNLEAKRGLERLNRRVST